MAKSTRAHPIALALRADILAGRLLPGAQLKFQSLVEEHDASVPVIREALTSLVERGLVVSEPHYGYRVKEHSDEDLLDLTHARQAVEPLVLEDSVRHGTPEWEANVIGAHHLLTQTPVLNPDDPARVNDQWSVAHTSFHTALLANSRGLRLRAFALRLRDESELLRRRSIASANFDPHDMQLRHRELMELAVSRKANEAADALRAHIVETAELVLNTSLNDWMSHE